MIVYDKALNTNNGSMNAKTALVGENYPIPTKGFHVLKSIEEDMGNNKKPILLLKYDGNIIIELPDYGIEKLRDDK
jgi:hypothetical protein